MAAPDQSSEVASRRPSGLRKTIADGNSLAHRTTWLRSDLACSPTGMPGPNTAFRNGLTLSSSLPETAFGRPGSKLRSRQASVSDEADGSQRPFAPPERLPVSRPPLRDRCSRPAASTSCRMRSFDPFDRRFLPSSPVSRIRGRSTPATRCRLPIRHPDRLPLSCSSSGLLSPSGSSLDRVPRPEACLRETSDFVHSPVVELFRVPHRITACDSLRFP